MCCPQGAGSDSTIFYPLRKVSGYFCFTNSFLTILKGLTQIIQLLRLLLDMLEMQRSLR